MHTDQYRKLMEIYITFFKLGCFSFGGGYAMIPLIEREAVQEKKWIEKEKIVDIFAVSESIPGAIAMNSSALVGYTVAGVPGAIAALVGNLTPSLVIVLTLSHAFMQYSNHPSIQSIFNGIRPAIIGLIAYASYKIGQTAIKDKTCAMIMVLSFIAILFFHIHPILIILTGAMSGILIHLLHISLDRYKAEKAEEGGNER